MSPQVCFWGPYTVALHGNWQILETLFFSLFLHFFLFSRLAQTPLYILGVSFIFFTARRQGGTSGRRPQWVEPASSPRRRLRREGSHSWSRPGDQSSRRSRWLANRPHSSRLSTSTNPVRKTKWDVFYNSNLFIVYPTVPRSDVQ